MALARRAAKWVRWPLMPRTFSAARSAALVISVLLAGARAQELECVVYATDQRIQVQRPRGQWFAPDHVQRIEVAVTGKARDQLEAWVGTRAWPFGADPHKDVQVLVVDDRLRDSWRAGGRLTIGFATQRESGGELVLLAPPRRLALPDRHVQLDVMQRESAEVPGSDGYLRIHLDDITRGQVLLEVRGAEGATLVRRRSVRPGDRIDFDLGDAAYVVHVDRFVNHLFDEDSAILTISALDHFEGQRIEALLGVIGDADVTFVREGEEYAAKAAVEHIREKYRRAGGKVDTLDRFIDEVASKSSTTGRPYSIRLLDGTTMPAADWLRLQVKALEQAAAGKRGDNAPAEGPRARPKRD